MTEPTLTVELTACEALALMSVANTMAEAWLTVLAEDRELAGRLSLDEPPALVSAAMKLEAGLLIGGHAG